MILLDTNVISETMRAVPDRHVLEWLDSLEEGAVGIPAVVMGELQYGVDLMPDGRRKEGLRLALERLAGELYRGCIIPFDQDAARHYGRLMARRELSGRQMKILDAQIAAIALANGAQLATRDGDFAECGIGLINPWQA